MQDHSCVCFFVCSIEVGKIGGCLRWFYPTLVSESRQQQLSPMGGGGVCANSSRGRKLARSALFSCDAMKLDQRERSGSFRTVNRTSDSLLWLISSLPFSWLDRGFSIPIKYDINLTIRVTSFKYDGCKYICEVTKSLCLGHLSIDKKKLTGPQWFEDRQMDLSATSQVQTLYQGSLVIHLFLL